MTNNILEKLKSAGRIAGILLLVLVPAVLGLQIGRSFGGDESIQTQIETRALQEVLDQVHDLALDNRGLRNRLRAREERQPERVVVSDTVIQRIPEDTVIVTLRMNDGGLATYGAYSRQIRGDSIGYRPFVAERIDLSDCDDGFSISGSKIVCDKARFGHLSVTGFLVGSALPTPPYISRQPILGELGFMWEPSYRSPWMISTTYGTDGLFRLRVGRSVELW